MISDYFKKQFSGYKKQFSDPLYSTVGQKFLNLKNEVQSKLEKEIVLAIRKCCCSKAGSETIYKCSAFLIKKLSIQMRIESEFRNFYSRILFLMLKQFMDVSYSCCRCCCFRGKLLLPCSVKCNFFHQAV